MFLFFHLDCLVKTLRSKVFLEWGLDWFEYLFAAHSDWGCLRLIIETCFSRQICRLLTLALLLRGIVVQVIWFLHIYVYVKVYDWLRYGVSRFFVAQVTQIVHADSLQLFIRLCVKRLLVICILVILGWRHILIIIIAFDNLQRTCFSVGFLQDPFLCSFCHRVISAILVAHTSRHLLHRWVSNHWPHSSTYLRKRLLFISAPSYSASQ